MFVTVDTNLWAQDVKLYVHQIVKAVVFQHLVMFVTADMSLWAQGATLSHVHQIVRVRLFP